MLAKLFEDRGVELLRTYQLNFGGNMDFMNMLERKRLVSKKVSKTQSVTSQIPHEMEKAAVHIGPSDHVPWLDDRKWAYIRLEGRAFGDVPLNLEYKLEVWDSPNSAGVIIDAIRAAKIAKDRGIGGPILSAASYFMKSPPRAVRRRRRPATWWSSSSAARSSADPSDLHDAPAIGARALAAQASAADRPTDRRLRRRVAVRVTAGRRQADRVPFGCPRLLRRRPAQSCCASGISGGCSRPG